MRRGFAGFDGFDGFDDIDCFGRAFGDFVEDFFMRVEVTVAL